MPVQDKSRASSRELPLIVDLDGTLLLRDVFFFQLLSLVKGSPLKFLRVVLLLLIGNKQKAKQLAAASYQGSVSIEDLKLNIPLTLHLKKEAKRRELWIASGAAQENVDQVVSQLDFFQGGFGSSCGVNLVGEIKGKMLADRFGPAGFDYIGDSRVDLQLKGFARTVVLVHDLTGEARYPGGRLKTLLSAMRIKHWVKNVLVAVPMLAAHQFSSLSGWLAVGVVIFCLGLVSSAGYIINDLLDLGSDLKHPEKSKRPIASGDLAMPSALKLSAMLVFLGVVLSFGLLGVIGAGIVGAYLFASLLYSVVLKQLVLVDVATLASLFVMRIAAGVIITGVSFSTWLFAFAWLFFLGLAIMKRAIENGHVSEEKDFGRSYKSGDGPLLFSMGLASSFSAVIVLVIYATSRDAQVQYASPQLLVLALPLVLFWSARAWLLAHRGEIQADPVDWAIRDRQTLWMALATLIIFVTAS